MRRVPLKGLSSNLVTYELIFREKDYNSQLSLSQSGTGIFCLVIAAHTFSLLFFRRQWSDRTSYIVLIVSWAFNFLELALECFVFAKPKTKGPYFGVSGYWCWITPAYPMERYATSYLIMFVSAGFSFILYLLVFFRLRGNISVEAGYKISFHERPKVRVGRTTNGTYIVTDDHRVESHLTTVAKHMLWYPLVYTVLVLPQAAARYAGFSGAPVPFAVTVATAVLFLLHGFVNTLLFCTTRNVLPGSWRQRLGISTMGDSGGRSDVGLSSRANASRRFTGFGVKYGTETAPVVLSVGVEKDVEVKYEEARLSPSYLKFSTLPPPASPGTPASPTPLLRTHAGGGKRANNHNHLIHEAVMDVPIKVDENDGDSDLSAGPDPASNAETIGVAVPLRPLRRAHSRHESGPYGPAPGLEAAPAHRVTMAQPAGRTYRHPPFISTSGTTSDPVWAGRAL